MTAHAFPPKSCSQSRTLARCGNPVSLARRLGRQKQKDGYTGSDWYGLRARFSSHLAFPLTSTMPSFGLRAWYGVASLFPPMKTVT